MVTIPRADWEPALVPGSDYVVGQPEIGATGYRHWQLLVHFPTKKSLASAKESFPAPAHLEPTRSAAAREYVTKEETRDGEPFEFGRKPVQRNSATDWDEVRSAAMAGKIEEIPADIFIRYYSSLRTIASDYQVPEPIQKEVHVFYGPTGSGKTRRAYAEAGSCVYFKDPRSKFWCGYRCQENVIIDEFRGAIDISHLLRWLDRYPVRVELKGSSRPLCARRIWITSNIHPDCWYEGLDLATLAALKRRMTIELIE